MEATVYSSACGISPTGFLDIRSGRAYSCRRETRVTASSQACTASRLRTTFSTGSLFFSSNSSSTPPLQHQHHTTRRGFQFMASSKMVVPDFGGKSPEAKAAENLHNFFTYLAVRIVLSQLQAYNPEGYQELKVFTESHSGGFKDGDKFCADLMRVSYRHKKLALRIMEVRAAYCKEDFEWENLRSIAHKRTENGNRELMCDFVLETMKLE